MRKQEWLYSQLEDSGEVNGMVCVRVCVIIDWQANVETIGVTAEPIEQHSGLD